jgi:hypothetical protein
MKESFRDGFRDGTQSFITDAELLRMLKRILRLIDNPEAYTFQQQTYSLTLSGTNSYDLDTLIPGWKRILTINNSLGVSDGIPLELNFVDMKDLQMIIDRYVYSIYQNRYLRLYSPNTSPLTGVLTIIYYTAYLCKDAITGAYKPMIEVDDDYFAIPERWLDVITEGLLWLAFRKDRSNREDAADAKSSFEKRLMELITQETVQVQYPYRTMSGAF